MRNKTSRMNLSLSGWVGMCFLLLLYSCQPYEVPIAPPKGYPRAVAEVVFNNCATSGCHAGTGVTNAGGLDLSNWQAAFQGSDGGSAIIPGDLAHSFLGYYLNTNPDSGIISTPAMPLQQSPLSTADRQSD